MNAKITPRKPSERYKELVDSGKTVLDDHQLETLLHLDHLYDQLIIYDKWFQNAVNQSASHPIQDKKRSSVSVMANWLISTKINEVEASSASESLPPKLPKSLYLWGGTGTGKTFLMDLFYETLPVTRKSRVHFHSFMIDVHKRLHRQRQELHGQPPDPHSHGSDDIMKRVVKASIYDNGYIVCFDEFQVSFIYRHFLENDRKN